MKKSKHDKSFILRTYDRIEAWCAAPGASRAGRPDKRAARYFFAWMTSIIIGLALIAAYALTWYYTPSIALIATGFIIVPIVLFYLSKWIRWIFSDDN